LPWSERDGLPTLAESMLWELEARHPEVVRRSGSETSLLLDRVYRVVEHPDRSYVSLVAISEAAHDARAATVVAAPAPIPA
jgi:hypothetical protein